VRNGHMPGYKMKKVGDQVFYYCSCLPNVQWNDLKYYDMHYELNHARKPAFAPEAERTRRWWEA
jgi:hypothetical protein